MENYIYEYKNHSNLFNKYFCLIENASDIDVYYAGVYDFLKYKFRKILIEKLRENESNSLNDNDIKFLQKLKLKTQYNVFLKTFFDGVNRFEREQFPCYNTGLMFRKLNELIQLLDEWGSIPEYWLKIKKYCKYKAVDIFKKLKNGDIPKTGGPKEKITKNDLENKDLFEYAQQEKMDLNEINKAIYNQRNGNGKRIHNKEEDDKDLKQFLNFQDRNNDNVYNQNKEIISNNYQKEDYENGLEEFQNEISIDFMNSKKIEPINSNKKENVNSNKIETINSNKIETINSNKIETINSNKIENVMKKISNVNSKIISNAKKDNKNKDDEQYESIGRASPIRSKNDDANKNIEKTTNKKDFEEYNSIDRASAVNLKNKLKNRDPSSLHNVNKLFSKNHQSSLKNAENKFEFLDEIVESKLKQKRIASISNRIIDQDYIEKEVIEHEKKNEIEKNNYKKIQQPYTSRETKSQVNIGYNKINFQSENPFKKNNQELKSENKHLNSENNNEDLTVNINRTRTNLYNEKENLNDLKNNSLYIINDNHKNPNYELNSDLENKIQINNNNLEHQNNIYEDINATNYEIFLNKNSELHSFNPRNSFNNIKGEFKNINSHITPQPPEDESYSNINRSVFVSTNYSNNLSTEINNNNQTPTYEKGHNKDFNDKQKIQNYGNINQIQNPVYSEIPCVLGAGYKFTYDKHIGSANQNINKNNFINKIAHSNHKKEDDIEKMLKDLKGNKNINTQNVQNFTKENKLIENREKEKSPIKGDINPQDFSQNYQQQKILEDKNTDLIKQNSNEINSPNKNKNFSSLNTNMLKNFDLRNYKNLPNFEIPLQYNTPEKKANLKRFFINTAKESMIDIKKDDIQSTIKKMELLLYYFTNIKDN